MNQIHNLRNQEFDFSCPITNIFYLLLMCNYILSNMTLNHYIKAINYYKDMLFTFLTFLNCFVFQIYEKINIKENKHINLRFY